VQQLLRLVRYLVADVKNVVQVRCPVLLAGVWLASRRSA
jgi:hypothetical protein